VEFLQDVTEENAELALGVKANKGLIPPAAAATGKHPCRKFPCNVYNDFLWQYWMLQGPSVTLTVVCSTLSC